MQKHAIIASAIGTFAALALLPGQAQANARICRQLQHEAQQLRQMGSGTSRARLERKLASAEREVRHAGCSGLRLIFGGASKRKCQVLRSNMNRLRAQLNRSSRTTRSPERQLRNVQVQMQRHGCSDSSGGASRQASARNGYRTMCVRKCDGYYFPIGFATPRNELSRDQAICEAFYPDGAAELFIRPTRAKDNDAAMVSLSGEAYGDQPFAFSYRSSYQPACASLLRARAKPADKPGEKSVAIDASAIVPVPSPRPSPSGTVDVATTRPVDAVTDVGQDRSRHVRIVGPATPYLIAQPADGATTPIASAPAKVSPTDASTQTSWLDRLSNLFAPAAQAQESTD